jgi:hypothetical protein
MIELRRGANNKGKKSKGIISLDQANNMRK